MAYRFYVEGTATGMISFALVHVGHGCGVDDYLGPLMG
jgi:hypothetical protein